MSLTTKFGQLVNGSMSTANKITLLRSMNVNYARINAIELNRPFNGTTYNTYRAAGINVLLNFNWDRIVGGVPVPFPTDMTDYGTKLADKIDALSYTPELIVLENEEINPNYHSWGSMSEYADMLATAKPIIHSRSLKFTNGGVYGTGYHMLVFRYLNDNYDLSTADAYADNTMTSGQRNAAFIPNSNPSLEQLATNVFTVLIAVRDNCDYLNIHPYEDFDKDDDLTARGAKTTITPNVLRYMQEYGYWATAVPVITNETGIRDNVQPSLVTAMLQEYEDLGFEYCIWFNGEGSEGAKSLNQQVSPYSLLPNGEAYRDFMLGGGVVGGALTFEEFRTEVLNRSKRIEVCDVYQAALNSTTYEALLLSSCGLYEWLYRTGIVDDAILGNIDEAVLNSYGIYMTGTFTLDNPIVADYDGCHSDYIELESAPDEVQKLYFLKESVLNTLELHDSGNCELTAMGNSSITAYLSGNSKLVLKVLDEATATIILFGNSILCVESSGGTVTSVVAQDNSVVIAKTDKFSNFGYFGYYNSYLNIKTFGNSQAECILSDSATMDKETNFQSTINVTLS